jgi:DNA polymerase-4
MEARLKRFKVNTVAQLYALNRDQLRSAWCSIEGERYYDKLRGIEPIYIKNARSSLGHSHVLPPDQRNVDGAKAVLHRLLQKAAMRMRSYELLTTQISIKVKLRNQPSFYCESAISATDSTLTLVQALETLWQQFPHAQVEPIAVGVNFSGLTSVEETAYDLFAIKPTETEKKLNKALDVLNLKYGKNTVYFAGAHQALKDAPMRIAFNHIPNLTVEDDG